MPEGGSSGLAGRELAGCRVEGLVGTGTSGSVYRAHQLSMDRPVALKILDRTRTVDPSARERFHREARTAARVEHPNIVRVFDVGEAEVGSRELAFIVMELVRGRSLEEVLDERGHLSPAEALELLEPCARALEHARAEGMVHRDIKPANILLADDGTVKLADLGLAKIVEPLAEEGQGGTLTVAGSILGTPHFMSPEQARDARNVDHRTDVYALGATLYRCVYGRPPHDAGTPMEVISKVLYREPAFPSLGPEVDRLLVPLLRRTLAKEPGERFETAGELLAELRAVREDLPETPGDPPPRAAPVPEPGTRAARGGEATRPAPDGPAAGRSPSGRSRRPSDRVRRPSDRIPRPSDRVARRRSGRPAAARRSRRTRIIAMGVGALLVGLGALAWWATRPPPPVDRGSTAEGSGEASSPEAGDEPAPQGSDAEGTARQLLEDALAWHEEHPDQPAAALRRFRAILAFEGSGAATEAARHRDRLLAAIEDRFAGVEQEVRDLVREGRYDRALARLEEGVAEADGVTSILERADDVRQEVETAYREHVETVEEMVREALREDRHDRAVDAADRLRELARGPDRERARSLHEEAVAARRAAEESERSRSEEEERAARTRALREAVRALRRALGAGELDSARATADALGPPLPSAWVEALDRDVSIHEEVVADVGAWLERHEGRRLPPVVGSDGRILAGRLEAAGGTWIVRTDEGPERLEPTALPPLERLRLGVEGRGEPYGTGERTIVLLYAGQLDRAAERIAGTPSGPDRERLERRLAILRAMVTEAAARAREEEASDLLARADRAWDRGNRAEAIAAYRRLLEAYGSTEVVGAARTRIRSRREAPAEAEADEEAPVPWDRILAGEVRELPDGRIEVAYDLETPDQLADFERREILDPAIPSWAVGPLRAFLMGEQEDIYLPRELRGIPPWNLVAVRSDERVLFTRGWEELAWEGRLRGPVEVEFDALPLAGSNLIVTIGPPGERQDRWFLGMGYHQPVLNVPRNWRERARELVRGWERFSKPAWRILEGPGMGPDIEARAEDPDLPFPDREIEVEARRWPPGEAPEGEDLEEPDRGLLSIAIPGTSARLRHRYDRARPDPVGIGLGTPGSAAIIDDLVIRGRVDPRWLERRLDELEEEDEDGEND